MLRCRVAAHAMINDRKAVGAEQTLQMLRPGLAFAREDIERRGAADQGDDGLALELLGIALAAPSSFRVHIGHFAGAAGHGRRDLSDLQKRVPVVVGPHIVSSEQRFGRGKAQLVEQGRAEPEADFQGRQRQQDHGQPGQSCAGDGEEKQPCEVAEVPEARRVEMELVLRDQPQCHGADHQRESAGDEEGDGSFEAARVRKADLVEKKGFHGVKLWVQPFWRPTATCLNRRRW